MRIQQAKDLYELADEGQEKIDAKAALKLELQKEVPKHEDMLAKVKADANTNPSARSEGASTLSWAWFPGRGSLGLTLASAPRTGSELTLASAPRTGSE